MSMLKIFEKMRKDNNQELKMAPLRNVTSAVSGKDGWGTISIAVPNDIIQQMIVTPEKFVGGLIIAPREEYDKYELKDTSAERYIRTIDELRRVSIPRELSVALFNQPFPDGKQIEFTLEGDTIMIRKHDTEDESKDQDEDK